MTIPFFDKNFTKTFKSVIEKDLKDEPLLSVPPCTQNRWTKYVSYFRRKRFTILYFCALVFSYKGQSRARCLFLSPRLKSRRASDEKITISFNGAMFIMICYPKRKK